MTKRMLIDAQHPEEARVAITENGKIQEFDFVTTAKKQIKGNIFLAKITRVEPSLQAAFVEYGGGKQGFLPFAEIHPDYYQIPIADRKRLIEEAERAAEEEERAEEAGEAQPAYAPTEEINAAEEPENENAAEVVGQIEQGAEIPGDVVQAFPSFLDQGIESSSQETPAEAPASAPSEPAYQSAQAPEAVAYAEPTSPHIEGGSAETSVSPEFAAPTENPPLTEIGDPAEVTPPAEEVETLSSEEERRPRRQYFQRRYKIQEVIKRNQIVLVQVIKEERGNKGVSLTTYISLAGRYCVLMPNSPKDGGISRKIASNEDRRRLKQISTELRLSAGMSAIIRTAGMDRSHAEIRRDFDYLVKLWNDIREKTLSSTAPALVYEEGDIVKRSIRDMYHSDIDEIIVEGEAAFNTAKEFMRMILPSHAPKVKEHRENLPLFYAYDVEEQMLSMHDPIVRLRSGGYIVVNPTEALIAIDVNSGRATGERNIEETASKTNLEAAAEIARQVRLRDLAGLIVIDFIDMLEGRNRRNVERALKDALKRDRAKIQLGRISAFGLMEMSRQRLRPSIAETNMTPCPHCLGRGVVRSNDSIAIQIIRALEKEAATGAFSELRLITSSIVAAHLFNTKRQVMGAIEQEYELRIVVAIDENLPPTGFKIDKNKRNNSGGDNDNATRRGRNRGRVRDSEEVVAENIEAAAVDEAVISPEPAAAEPSSYDDNNKRPRRGRGRHGGGRFERDNDTARPTPAGASDFSTSPEPGAAEEGQADNGNRERGNNRSRRGGRDRGRRKWRDRSGETNNANANNNAPAPVAPVQTMESALPREFSFDQPPQAPRQDFVFDKGNTTPSASPSTENDTSGPTRKGWWRRMTE